MIQKKKEHPKEKLTLHPRNKHRGQYDFKQLTDSCPELTQFVKLNNYQDESIDFFNPEAVKALNKAILKHFYNIESWDIPKNYLCPPIPGRADYIHHLADLLASGNIGIYENKIPAGNAIKCLDIGVGANCIYPIIGNKEYCWSFVGTDTDKVSIESAMKIIGSNPSLIGQIEIRWQSNPKDIFNGIIQKDEKFDLTICNPPFHASAAEAQSASIRKLRNLKHKRITNPILNFGGQNNELWCEGGEGKFVENMIYQSKQFSGSCFWFSTLISKESNLKNIYKLLKEVEAVEIKTIPMSHGNKTSRIVAWTFLKSADQKNWIKNIWNTINK